MHSFIGYIIERIVSIPTSLQPLSWHHCYVYLTSQRTNKHLHDKSDSFYLCLYSIPLLLANKKDSRAGANIWRIALVLQHECMQYMGNYEITVRACPQSAFQFLVEVLFLSLMSFARRRSR